MAVMRLNQFANRIAKGLEAVNASLERLIDFSCLLLVLWPLDLANGFHLIVIFTLSFIFTSFVYASFDK